MENIDPKLRSNLSRFKEMLTNVFESSKYIEIRDPNIKNSLGFQEYARKLTNIELYNKLKYQAHGYFSFGDVFAANGFRFVLNWLEAFNFKFGSFNSASTSVSRNFVRSVFAGSINTSSFLAWNSIAAQTATQRNVNPFSFWMTSQAIQLLFAPLTAFATHMHLNGKLCYQTALNAQINPLKLVYNALFGLAINMHNSESSILNYFYYPAVVLSSTFYRIWSKELFLTASEPILAQKLSENYSKEAFEKVVQKTKILNGSDRAAIVVLSLINFAVPVVIPQLRPREEYKSAWLEYVQNDRSVKLKEKIYE
jgi:hypothetical protein